MGRYIVIILMWILVGECHVGFCQPPIGRWTPPINVSNAAGYSIMPDMTVGPDGRIHVVWADNARTLIFNNYDILYSVYTENSCFWSAPLRLSPLADTYSGDPRVAVDSWGIPHVVWTHRNLYPDADIYYSTLTNTGWTLPLNLSTVGTNHRGPDIAIDDRDYIHVVWSQYLDGAFNVVHRYYDGWQWSELINASNSTVNVSQPRLVRGIENELHLVWKKPTSGGNGDITYSRYDGSFWSPGQDVTQNPATISTDADLAADTQGNPHVVWEEHLNPNLWEVFYGYFDGFSWSTPQNISNQQLLSMNPRIAFNSRNLCCVLFVKAIENGNPPYVQYTFTRTSIWTPPDTMLNNYISNNPAISSDANGLFHACLSIVPPSPGDIGYTQFIAAIQANNPAGNSPQIPIICAFPNPFIQSTAINYSLEYAMRTSLSIYDIQGRLIKILQPSLFRKGLQQIIWDGTNKAGAPVSTGLYILELQGGNESAIKKIYLVR